MRALVTCKKLIFRNQHVTKKEGCPHDVLSILCNYLKFNGHKTENVKIQH